MMWIQFLRDRRASVAPIFAIALLPMLIATGAAIDFSRAFRQRIVVQDSLDAAALAAGKQLGISKDDDVKQLAQDFYATNVGSKVDIIPSMTPDITSGQPTLTLRTQLKVPTYFLGMVGISQFTYNLVAQSTQAMGTIEVALALDNSTSMTIPSTKIAALKSAAQKLVDKLWTLEATSTKPQPVRIAVVPFGAAVNVGSGATWVDKTGAGTYAGDAMKDATLLGAGNAADASFNPFSIFSTLKDSSGNAVSWGGCVEERPAPYDISDDPPSTAGSPTAEQRKTLFQPLIAPDEPDNWTCAVGTSGCSYVGTTNATRRFNGAPTSNTPDFNNYLPDAGDSSTCGTLSANLSSITAGKPAVFNKNGHGLAADTSVAFSTTGSLPAGITAGSRYFVSPAGLTANAFSVATTTTGSSLTIGPQLTTVTMTLATPTVFTSNSHGMTAGTGIIFSTTGALPTGVTAGTTYYVATVPSTNTFTVSAASAGTTITASTNTFTKNSHGLTAGTALQFRSSNTLPSPLALNTTYYVLSANLATNSFRVSTTTNGTAVSVSGGSGTLSYYVLTKTTGSQTGIHSYTKVGAPSLFTSSNHGLAVGDPIAISTTATMPTPLSASTIYYVVSVPTTNTFTISATSGGTGINVTGASSGMKFIELLATTNSSQSGTQSYATNTDAFTCQTGADCGGTDIGQSEKTAFGGQSLASAPLCKYGTTTHKGTVSNFQISGIQAGPNYMCSTTPITSLTTSHDTVKNAITAMQANGYTNITSGLMWAWRVLSAAEPFPDDRADNAADNKKIIVLMTDGENTYLPYLEADQNPAASTYSGKFVKSAYGAWGYIAENHLNTVATTSQPIMDKLNARLSAACTAAAAAHMMIYTVGFEINTTTASDPATTKALLQNCATEKYFDAQNEKDLEDAFGAIGEDISLLRLSM